MSLTDGPDRAQAQYDAADNMTQQLTALSVLLRQKAGDDALRAVRVHYMTPKGYAVTLCGASRCNRLTALTGGAAPVSSISP